MSDESYRLLRRIKAFSPYLTHILRQQPSLVDEIFGREGYREKRSFAQLSQRLKEKLVGVKDFQAFCLMLRRFKQEEILRIAAQEDFPVRKKEDPVAHRNDLLHVMGSPEGRGLRLFHVFPYFLADELRYVRIKRGRRLVEK